MTRTVIYSTPEAFVVLWKHLVGSQPDHGAHLKLLLGLPLLPRCICRHITQTAHTVHAQHPSSRRLDRAKRHGRRLWHGEPAELAHLMTEESGVRHATYLTASYSTCCRTPVALRTPFLLLCAPLRVPRRMIPATPPSGRLQMHPKAHSIGAVYAQPPSERLNRELTWFDSRRRATKYSAFIRRVSEPRECRELAREQPTHPRWPLAPVQ